MCISDPEVSSQDTPVGYDNPGLANPPAPVPATQYETVTVDKVIYASEALDPLLVGPFQDTNFLIWFKVMAALVVTVVLASFSAGLVYHFAG